MPFNSNRFTNEVGNRYGRLVVTASSGKDNHNNAMWESVCDCGKTKRVMGRDLRNGNTKDCGWECGLRPHNQKRKTRNGQAFRLVERVGSDKAHDIWLQKTYNITFADYCAMSEAQEGKCAICQEPPSGNDKRLAVDHDHTTGVVRGLLCRKCNAGLGAFRDDSAYVEAALTYLRNAQPLEQVA